MHYRSSEYYCFTNVLTKGDPCSIWGGELATTVVWPSRGRHSDLIPTYIISVCISTNSLPQSWTATRSLLGGHALASSWEARAWQHYMGRLHAWPSRSKTGTLPPFLRPSWVARWALATCTDDSQWLTPDHLLKGHASWKVHSFQRSTCHQLVQ